MKTIENLLISQGEIDRIYKGELTLYLWRALHKSVKIKNPLYPDFILAKSELVSCVRPMLK
jgi:hypothetical protein